MDDSSHFRTIEISDPAYEHDGLRLLTVKTPNLLGRGDICLFVPEAETAITDLPIYLLLHGVYGSAWVWAWKGGAHRTAARLIQAGDIQPAIIAMPSDGLWGDGSGYFGHHQKQFDRWIVEDVPRVIREMIPAAGKHSALCIGGLSMGGYGALSLGARFAEQFAAVSGHSSITKLEQMADFVEEPLTAYTAECTWPDVIDTIKTKKEHLPPIRFDCGMNDPLIEPNRLLHRQLEAAGIAHTYEEFPGGHEWPYWQTHVERTFRFFDKNV